MRTVCHTPQPAYLTYFALRPGRTIPSFTSVAGNIPPNGWSSARSLPPAPCPLAPCCSRCYEVKCDPASFNDGYGQWLDRSNVCRDPDRSVIVQVGAIRVAPRPLPCKPATQGPRVWMGLQ